MKAIAGTLLILAVVAVSSAHALTERVTISSVTVSESAEDTTIDVVQNSDCNGDGSTTTTDTETFLDTKAHLTVTNGLNRTVRITRFWYRVRIGGKLYTSRKIGIIGSGYIPSDSEQEILSLFAHARGGLKYLIRSAAPIPADTGVRNVTVFLSGDDGAGRSFTVRSSTVVNFTDADNC